MISYPGLIFAALKSRITTGPLVDTLNYFEIHLSAQVKCLLRIQESKRHITEIYVQTPIQQTLTNNRQSRTQL